MLVRPANMDDLPHYLRLQEESWGYMKAAEKIATHRFEVCLAGILVAVSDDGRPVGATTMIRLPAYDFDRPLTWNQATANGWCDTHSPDGPVYFGVDLSVTKSSPGNGTVDALVAAGMELVVSSEVQYCVWGGRMPGYHRHLDRYPNPTEYAHARRGRHYLDPQVQMYSEIPFNELIGVIPDYFDDPESLNYGVLWRWRNPHFLPSKS